MNTSNMIADRFKSLRLYYCEIPELLVYQVKNNDFIGTLKLNPAKNMLPLSYAIGGSWDYALYKMGSYKSMEINLRYDTFMYIDDPELVYKRINEGMTIGAITPQGYYKQDGPVLKFVSSHNVEWDFVYRLYHHASRVAKKLDISYYEDVLKQFEYYLLFNDKLIFEYKAIEIALSEGERIASFLSEPLEFIEVAYDIWETV